MKDKLTIQNITNALKKHGYILYEDKLNIIGIRATDMTPNVFNDYIVTLWKTYDTWNIGVYKATTDPGLYYLQNPMNVKGTFIMVPGQYIDVYEIGFHTGYPALRQVGKIKGYRDKDKDKIFDLDPSTTDDGINATNIHHAGQDSKQVDRWSAGCQVIANMKDWISFWNTVMSFQAKQKRFSYTLINEVDL